MGQVKAGVVAAQANQEAADQVKAEVADQVNLEAAVQASQEVAVVQVSQEAAAVQASQEAAVVQVSQEVVAVQVSQEAVAVLASQEGAAVQANQVAVEAVWAVKAEVVVQWVAHLQVAAVKDKALKQREAPRNLQEHKVAGEQAQELVQVVQDLIQLQEVVQTLHSSFFVCDLVRPPCWVALIY